MAKRNFWKRDQRGRFASTSGGSGGKGHRGKFTPASVGAVRKSSFTTDTGVRVPTIDAKVTAASGGGRFRGRGKRQRSDDAARREAVDKVTSSPGYDRAMQAQKRAIAEDQRRLVARQLSAGSAGKTKRRR